MHHHFAGLAISWFSDPFRMFSACEARTLLKRPKRSVLSCSPERPFPSEQDFVLEGRQAICSAALGGVWSAWPEASFLRQATGADIGRLMASQVASPSMESDFHASHAVWRTWAGSGELQNPVWSAHAPSNGLWNRLPSRQGKVSADQETPAPARAEGVVTVTEESPSMVARCKSQWLVFQRCGGANQTFMRPWSAPFFRPQSSQSGTRALRQWSLQDQTKRRYLREEAA